MQSTERQQFVTCRMWLCLFLHMIVEAASSFRLVVTLELGSSLKACWSHYNSGSLGTDESSDIRAIFIHFLLRKFEHFWMFFGLPLWHHSAGAMECC